MINNISYAQLICLIMMNILIYFNIFHIISIIHIFLVFKIYSNRPNCHEKETSLLSDILQKTYYKKNVFKLLKLFHVIYCRLYISM